MNVLIFSEVVPKSDGFCMNGIARHIAFLQSSLPKVGVTISIITSGQKKETHGIVHSIPGTLKKEGGEGYMLAKSTSWTGRRVMSAELKKADLYHLHHPSQMGLYGAFRAKILRKPVIFTWHTFYIEYAGFYKGKYISEQAAKKAAATALQIANLATAVIVPSQAAAVYAKEHAKLDDAQVIVIPTAAKLPDPALLSVESGRTLRQKFSIPLCAILLTSSGRQGYEKGFSEVIKAFFLVQKEHSSLYLVLAGREGLATTELHELVKDLGITDRVIFVGHLGSELTTLYSESLLLLSASPYETQGLTVSEAAACATPAVVINRGGLAEQVVQGETGYICKCNAKDLAQAVERLVKDPRLAKKMGENARKRVEEYTPLHMAERIKEVYAQVIKKR